MKKRVVWIVACMALVTGCNQASPPAAETEPVLQNSSERADPTESKPTSPGPAEESTPLSFEEQYPWDVPDGFTRLSAWIAVNPVSDPPRCSDSRDYLCVFYEVITNVEEYPDDCSVFVDVIFIDESNRIVDDAWAHAKVPKGLVRLFELSTREPTAVRHELVKASCAFSKGHPLLGERETTDRLIERETTVLQ